MIGEMVKKLDGAPYGAFRIIVGLLFLMHGAQKWGILGMGEGFPVSGFSSAFGVPLPLAYIVYTIEFLGGLCILLGIFTRTATFLGSLVMIGALAIAHLPKTLNPLGQGGGEIPLLFLACFFILMMEGAKVWSLERLIFRKDRW